MRATTETLNGGTTEGKEERTIGRKEGRRYSTTSAGGLSEPLRGGSWADPLSKPHAQNLIAGKVRLVGTRLLYKIGYANKGSKVGGMKKGTKEARGNGRKEPWKEGRVGGREEEEWKEEREGGRKRGKKGPSLAGRPVGGL